MRRNVVIHVITGMRISILGTSRRVQKCGKQNAVKGHTQSKMAVKTFSVV